MPVVQTYEVDVVYKGRDEGAQKAADRLGASLSLLQGGIDRVGAGLGMAASAMERLGLAAATMVGGAAVASVRALASEMVSINQSAEDTRIAIAGMLQANGAISGWTESFSQSAALMAQIRRDAAALPGEAEDYIQIFRSGLAPALQSGLDAMGAARLADRFGAVTSMMQIDAEQAGRDLNLILQGHAGAQVRSWGVLQAQIGKTAEEFNKLSREQRRVLLDQALGRYDDAIAAAGRSWSGMWGTLQSFRREAVQALTASTFERMKDRAQEFIAYLDEHGDDITEVLEGVGERGAEFFDRLYERAQEGIDFVRTHWRELRDEVLDDGRRLLGVWAMLRGGQMGAGAISSGLSLFSTLRGAGLVGGAAEGAGAAAGGLGMGAAAAIVVPAAALLGASLLAVHDGTFDAAAALRDMQEPAAQVHSGLRELANVTRPLVAELGGAFLTSIKEVAVPLTAFAGGLLRISAFILRFEREVAQLVVADPFRRLLEMMGLRAEAGPDRLNGMSPEFAQEHSLGVVADLNGTLAAMVRNNNPVTRAGQDRRPAAPAGHTTIHNHFRIEQADNPERVALTVQHVMERERRHPTQSARPGLVRLP